MVKFDEKIFDRGRNLAFNHNVIDEVDAEIKVVGLHNLQDFIELLIAEESILHEGMHQLAELAAFAAAHPALLRELLQEREEFDLLHLVCLMERYFITQQPDDVQHFLVPKLCDSGLFYLKENLPVDFLADSEEPWQFTMVATPG
jgi:hypothetical protein